MLSARMSSLVGLSILFAMVGLAAGPAVAREPKPEKLPVAMGSWKGPGASTFKSALRGGLGKECKIVSAKAALAIIEGEVTAKGKGVVVNVSVKAARTGEVVERREFPYARPRMSRSQSDRMARQVVEMARRAPPP